MQHILGNKVYLGLAGAVIIAALAIAGYFGYQYFQPKPTTDVQKLVAEVGKLIDLPTGEDPTLATVTDVEKLKDQPFFQKAKNGNVVLIYAKAKKAILYDPVLKKIVEVAPLNIDPNPQASNSATVAGQPVKIILRNGTTAIGLTTKFEPKVKSSVALAKITDKENAAKDNYEESVVVYLNESAKDEADKLAADLKFKVVDALPAGESKPENVDIVIILGNNAI